MNKIKFGLKNVHYAIITEEAIDGTVTVNYATPVPHRGAVTLVLNSTAEKTSIAADDIAEYATAYDNKGYDGELEMHNLDDDFRVNVLGEKKDANNVIYESEDTQPKKIALLFEMAGDKKKTRHILYNCSVSKPNLETSTKGGSIESKSDKLTFSASASADKGHIKAKINQGDAQYENWFKTVYIPTETAQTTEE